MPIPPFKRTVSLHREGFSSDVAALGADNGLAIVRNEITNLISQPMAISELLSRIVQSLSTTHASAQSHAAVVEYYWEYDEDLQKWVRICVFSASITIADIGTNPAVIGIRDRQLI